MDCHQTFSTTEHEKPKQEHLPSTTQNYSIPTNPDHSQLPPATLKISSPLITNTKLINKSPNFVYQHVLIIFNISHYHTVGRWGCYLSNSFHLSPEANTTQPKTTTNRPLAASLLALLTASNLSTSYLIAITNLTW